MRPHCGFAGPWGPSLALSGLLLALAGCSLIPTPPPALPATAPLTAPTAAPGDPSYAHVILVRALEESGGTWRFEVTLQHPDEGEDHSVARWELLIHLSDGRTMRYTRELGQPHIADQPLTTALSGIEIPQEVTAVTVRAHDSRHGYGGQEITVDLNAETGPGFQVVHHEP